MVDSTRSGDVVDQCAARAAEFVVEDDASRECQEALKDALFDSVKGAGAVAFECEQVFAGPEDRLDALPDWGEVGSLSGLVFAAWPHDRRVELADGRGELAAGVAFVSEQCFAAVALATGKQFESDFALVAFGRGERERPRGAVWGEDRVEPEAPEVAGVRGAIPVVGSISEGGALDGLPAPGALNRGRVDQQQIVLVPGA